MAPATKVNGINIDQLFSTIDLLKEKPELAEKITQAVLAKVNVVGGAVITGLPSVADGQARPAAPPLSIWMSRIRSSDCRSPKTRRSPAPRSAPKTPTI